MNATKLFGSVLAVLVMVFSLFLTAPLTHAAAPFWYGTEPQPWPIPAGYDAFLLDDGVPGPPTMACTGAPPSLSMNAQMNIFRLFSFNNNPLGIRGKIINNPEKSWDAYTLLSCMNGCAHPDQPDKKFNALLIDNDGNFVHGWEDILPFPARMWPGGYVTGTATGGPTGVDSYALVRQDWDGNEVWRWDLTDYGIPGQFHHDYNLQGNPCGYYAPPLDDEHNFLPKRDPKVLALANHWPESQYYYNKTWVSKGHPARDTSDISQWPLYDDAFYIIDHKDRIKWQWFACDHFEQMGFSDAAKYAIMNTFQPGTASDICPDPNNPVCSKTDWLHFNNVNWLGPNKWYDMGDQRFHPDNLIFDSRNSSLVGIIANDDYAGFKKGDIVWRVGPDYGPGTPWASLDQIIGVHNAHMIPKTLPGGGNILMFDNGGLGGYGPLREDCLGTFPNALSDFSRVIEFNPITHEVVWEYKQPNSTADSDGDGQYKGNERKFFSYFMSGAQRLVNGNTLITEANMGRVFEVTKEGEVVWEYCAGTGQTRPGVPGELGAAVYRAYKVPKTWVP